jgi:glycosidase
MDRKTLKEEYKQKKTIGGIYRVTNKQNGKCLLNYAPDIQAKQNSFDFMVASGSCFDPRIMQDWLAFGNDAFRFEVLETLEKKKDQTWEQFVADLGTLAQIWDEKLGPTNRY